MSCAQATEFCHTSDTDRDLNHYKCDLPPLPEVEAALYMASQHIPEHLKGLYSLVQIVLQDKDSDLLALGGADYNGLRRIFINLKLLQSPGFTLENYMRAKDLLNLGVPLETSMRDSTLDVRYKIQWPGVPDSLQVWVYVLTHELAHLFDSIDWKINKYASDARSFDMGGGYSSVIVEYTEPFRSSLWKIASLYTFRTDPAQGKKQLLSVADSILRDDLWRLAGGGFCFFACKSKDTLPTISEALERFQNVSKLPIFSTYSLTSDVEDFAESVTYLYSGLKSQLIIDGTVVLDSEEQRKKPEVIERMAHLDKIVLKIKEHLR